MSEIAQAFLKIFEDRRWGETESVSGTGSSKHATSELVPQLQALFRELGVTSIVDAPCGDFNWIGAAVAGLDYTGLDVVEPVIDLARTKAAQQGATGVRFEIADIVTSPLPYADLYFVRDCLVHLTFDQTMTALANIAAAGTSWLLATTFPELGYNDNIALTGRWRPINLQLPPYGLPEPRRVIFERPGAPPTSHGGPKCMGLWALTDLHQALEAHRPG